MSENKKTFTDLAIIKSMYTTTSRALNIQNEKQCLIGFFKNELEFGKIIENSESVKAKKYKEGSEEVEYYIYKKEADYSIDYQRGHISRKNGGLLISGQIVYVDYKFTLSVLDTIFEIAIEQAHIWIINKIGIEFEGKIIDDLKYAESYYSLYLTEKMNVANLVYEKHEEGIKELKIKAEDYRNLALSYLEKYIKN